MSLLSICEWIQATRPATALRESLLVFPIIEGTHLLGLAFSVGTILITDLRLIGVTLKKEPVSDVMKQLQPWTLGGFAVMFLTGAMLFACEAAKCYGSVWFRFKMLFLLLTAVNALVFHLTIYRRLDEWDRTLAPPRAARLAGIFSLLLWALVIAAGRTTAYNL